MTVNDPHIEETSTSQQGSIKSKATEQASRLAENVKEEVTRREQNLRSDIADRAESVAKGLRKAKSDVDADSTIAMMFDRAADGVSGLADSLNSTDPAQMLGDVRRFARQQPGAFLGLSALAGFAAIRFLRAGSTSPSEPVTTSGYGNPSTTRATTSSDRPAASSAGATSINSTTGVGSAARPASADTSTVSGSRKIGGSYD
ncbi:hypothetical protein [Paracoccus hibiscisoli]|uniref:DUF3618 domain-containing protein n=1 Tax=Paracoccus hibiscisoli TaxID=2023261 RepID=A0A4U0QGA1_9RHOB|nr:hypothetical protein [Paracoccus hibiscisoli]TJZ79812.1 hypothetical protein FA740_18120 [Paracoccus hibiscisoli]